MAKRIRTHTTGKGLTPAEQLEVSFKEQLLETGMGVELLLLPHYC